MCLDFYRQRQLTSVSYYPILSLALADILCGICAMPAYIAKKHTAGIVTKNALHVMCFVFPISSACLLKRTIYKLLCSC